MTCKTPSCSSSQSINSNGMVPHNSFLFIPAPSTNTNNANNNNIFNSNNNNMGYGDIINQNLFFPPPSHLPSSTYYPLKVGPQVIAGTDVDGDVNTDKTASTTYTTSNISNSNSNCSSNCIYNMTLKDSTTVQVNLPESMMTTGSLPGTQFPSTLPSLAFLPSPTSTYPSSFASFPQPQFQQVYSHSHTIANNNSTLLTLNTTPPILTHTKSPSSIQSMNMYREDMLIQSQSQNHSNNNDNITNNGNKHPLINNSNNNDNSGSNKTDSHLISLDAAPQHQKKELRKLKQHHFYSGQSCVAADCKIAATTTIAITSSSSISIMSCSLLAVPTLSAGAVDFKNKSNVGDRTVYSKNPDNASSRISDGGEHLHRHCHGAPTASSQISKLSSSSASSSVSSSSSYTWATLKTENYNGSISSHKIKKEEIHGQGPSSSLAMPFNNFGNKLVSEDTNNNKLLYSNENSMNTGGTHFHLPGETPRYPFLPFPVSGESLQSLKSQNVMTASGKPFPATLPSSVRASLMFYPAHNMSFNSSDNSLASLNSLVQNVIYSSQGPTAKPQAGKSASMGQNQQKLQQSHTHAKMSTAPSEGGGKYKLRSSQSSHHHYYHDNYDSRMKTGNGSSQPSISTDSNVPDHVTPTMNSMSMSALGFHQNIAQPTDHSSSSKVMPSISPNQSPPLSVALKSSGKAGILDSSLPKAAYVTISTISPYLSSHSSNNNINNKNRSTASQQFQNSGMSPSVSDLIISDVRSCKDVASDNSTSMAEEDFSQNKKMKQECKKNSFTETETDNANENLSECNNISSFPPGQELIDTAFRWHGGHYSNYSKKDHGNNSTDFNSSSKEEHQLSNNGSGGSHPIKTEPILSLTTFDTDSQSPTNLNRSTNIGMITKSMNNNNNDQKSVAKQHQTKMDLLDNTSTLTVPYNTNSDSKANAECSSVNQNINTQSSGNFIINNFLGVTTIATWNKPSNLFSDSKPTCSTDRKPLKEVVLRRQEIHTPNSEKAGIENNSYRNINENSSIETSKKIVSSSCKLNTESQFVQLPTSEELRRTRGSSDRKMKERSGRSSSSRNSSRTCFQCSLVFNSAPDLLVHRYEVHSFVCGECDGRFLSESKLEQHKQTEHPSIKVCPSCRFSSFSEVDFSKHMWSEHGIKPNEPTSKIRSNTSNSEAKAKDLNSNSKTTTSEIENGNGSGTETDRNKKPALSHRSKEKGEEADEAKRTTERNEGTNKTDVIIDNNNVISNSQSQSDVIPVSGSGVSVLHHQSPEEPESVSKSQDTFGICSTGIFSTLNSNPSLRGNSILRRNTVYQNDNWGLDSRVSSSSNTNAIISSTTAITDSAPIFPSFRKEMSATAPANLQGIMDMYKQVSQHCRLDSTEFLNQKLERIENITIDTKGFSTGVSYIDSGKDNKQEFNHISNCGGIVGSSYEDAEPLCLVVHQRNSNVDTKFKEGQKRATDQHADEYRLRRDRKLFDSRNKGERAAYAAEYDNGNNDDEHHLQSSTPHAHPRSRRKRVSSQNDSSVLDNMPTKRGRFSGNRMNKNANGRGRSSEQEMLINIDDNNMLSLRSGSEANAANNRIGQPIHQSRTRRSQETVRCGENGDLSEPCLEIDYAVEDNTKFEHIGLPFAPDTYNYFRQAYLTQNQEQAYTRNYNVGRNLERNVNDNLHFKKHANHLMNRLLSDDFLSKNGPENYDDNAGVSRDMSTTNARIASLRDRGMFSVDHPPPKKRTCRRNTRASRQSTDCNEFDSGDITKSSNVKEHEEITNCINQEQYFNSHKPNQPECRRQVPVKYKNNSHGASTNQKKRHKCPKEDCPSTFSRKWSMYCHFRKFHT